MPTWDKSLFDTLYSSNGWPHGIQGAKKVPRFHYNWYGMQPQIQAQVERYIGLPGFAQVSDIAIIGGGYGWTAEVLSEYGINAISVETSPHILSTKDGSEEAELRTTLSSLGFDPDGLNRGALGVRFVDPTNPSTYTNPWSHWLRPARTTATVVDEDLSTNGSRRSVRQALGNNIDAIVTEFALDCMDTENDALTLIERCEQLRPNPATSVIHMVMKTPVPGFYEQADWASLVSSNGYNHTVIPVGG